MHMVELHNTKDLKVVKLVTGRDSNGLKHSGSGDCSLYFVAVLERRRRPTLMEFHPTKWILQPIEKLLYQTYGQNKQCIA